MSATARMMGRTAAALAAVWLCLGAGAHAQTPGDQNNGAVVRPVPVPGATPAAPAPAAAASPYDEYNQPRRGGGNAANPDSIGAFPRPTADQFPAQYPEQSQSPGTYQQPAGQAPGSPSRTAQAPGATITPIAPPAPAPGSAPAAAPAAAPAPASGAAAPAAAPAATPQEISFVTHLDKTAVWLGDLFHYQVFVDHAPSVQFVIDNLNKETINLDPLRVVAVNASTVPLKDGRQRLIVDLTLTYLTAGVNEVAIPQLSLFYFRRDGTTTSSEGAAAESLTVPGPTIGVRSALVGSVESDLRDAATVSPWPSSRRYVAWTGWGALLLLVVGGAWEGSQMMRRRRSGSGPDPRKQMAVIRSRWTQSVPDDFNNPQVVMDFYGRSSHDLREYVGYMLETPTDGLLAAELRAEMERHATNSDIAERAAKVLATCEEARYARNHDGADAESARTVRDDMEEIFAVGAKG